MNTQTEKLTRRRMIGLIGGATATVATGSLLFNAPNALAAGGPLEVTTNVNLYAEADGSSEIIRLVEMGEQVTNADVMHPEVLNGYRHVSTAQGEIGWINDAYLEPADAPPSDPVFNSFRFVTLEESLLSGPEGYPMATLSFGTQVEASSTYNGEFVYVRVWLEGGETYGWVRSWLLTPDTARCFEVVLPELEGFVPMLAEPGNENSWVADIPHGSKAIDYDDVVVDGYRGVETEYGTGWISQEYLGVG